MTLERSSQPHPRKHGHDFIDDVKRVRNEYGCGLVEAKNMMDRFGSYEAVREHLAAGGIVESDKTKIERLERSLSEEQRLSAAKVEALVQMQAAGHALREYAGLCADTLREVLRADHEAGDLLPESAIDAIHATLAKNPPRAPSPSGEDARTAASGEESPGDEGSNPSARDGDGGVNNPLTDSTSGGEAGAAGKSETPQGGVGIQTPRSGSIPDAALPGPEVGRHDPLPCAVKCEGGPGFGKGVKIGTLLDYLARRVTYNNDPPVTEEQKREFRALLDEARGAPPAIGGEVKRCVVTGNPCGTDTVRKDERNANCPSASGRCVYSTSSATIYDPANPGIKKGNVGPQY